MLLRQARVHDDVVHDLDARPVREAFCLGIGIIVRIQVVELVGVGHQVATIGIDFRFLGFVGPAGVKDYLVCVGIDMVRLIPVSFQGSILFAAIVPAIENVPFAGRVLEEDFFAVHDLVRILACPNCAAVQAVNQLYLV